MLNEYHLLQTTSLELQWSVWHNCDVTVSLVDRVRFQSGMHRDFGPAEESVVGDGFCVFMLPINSSHKIEEPMMHDRW